MRENIDYSSWSERVNPGQLTGTLQVEDDVPFLITDTFVYDITFTKDVDLKDVIRAEGGKVTVKVDELRLAGMIAPILGHIVVSGLTIAETHPTP